MADKYIANFGETIGEGDDAETFAPGAVITATKATKGALEALRVMGRVTYIGSGGGSGATGAKEAREATSALEVEVDLDDMKKAELEKIAADEGVDLSEAKNNDERVQAIRDHRAANA